MYDIVEALHEKHADDDASEAIACAMSHFEKVADSDMSVVRGWCLEALRETYRKMIETGDYAGATRTIKELYKIASEK